MDSSRIQFLTKLFKVFEFMTVQTTEGESLLFGWRLGSCPWALPITAELNELYITPPEVTESTTS